MKNQSTVMYQLTNLSQYCMSYVIITREDNVIIVDGGRALDMPLLKQYVGDRRISAWILTHPHDDHISGITHELFDHTSTRQTVRYEGESQETCVTVTWMKFCARLLALTGESKFADCMEQSFYNAYLSTLNTEHNESTNVNERAKGNLTAYSCGQL